MQRMVFFINQINNKGVEMKSCPKCGSDVELSGTVNCLCDKDFCGGQRCGANNLRRHYKCTNSDCGDEGTPPETMSYMQHHCQ